MRLISVIRVVRVIMEIRVVRVISEIRVVRVRVIKVRCQGH